MLCFPSFFTVLIRMKEHEVRLHRNIRIYVWQGYLLVVVHQDATKESTLYSLVIVLYT